MKAPSMVPQQGLNTPIFWTAPGFPHAYHQALYFNYSTEIMRCWSLLDGENNKQTVQSGGAEKPWAGVQG